tara:strand:- start:519 stop:665 length:147 start_codon:yes stop_codon:yes gene_type:complete
MEKDILIYFNSNPIEYLSVEKSTTIRSIKDYIDKKYKDVEIETKSISS